MQNTNTIINDLYSLANNEDYDDYAMDIIYKGMDQLFRDGKFIEANEVLKNINIDELSIQAMVGFLSITKTAMDKLPDRDKFCELVYEKIETNKEISSHDFIYICDLIQGMEL